MIASPSGRCSVCGETTFTDCGKRSIPHVCPFLGVPRPAVKFSRVEIEAVIAEVECKPYELRVVRVGRDGWAIQAALYREDVETLAMGWGHGAKFYVSPHSTREEIVQKALGACIAFANHEVRENFRWRKRAIFGPHLSHDRLWDIADEKVRRD